MEWLRWLDIDLTHDRAKTLGTELRHLVSAARHASSDVNGAIPSQVADRIAADILAAVRRPPTN